MADVWISTGRRYCETCKVWFGNNKISQDFHERSEKHKGMLQKRIRDMSLNAKKKDQETQRVNDTIAMMQSAAAASMEAHGERITHGPALPPTGLRMNIFDPKQHRDVTSMAREMSSRAAGGKRAMDMPSGLEMPSMKVTKEDMVGAIRDLTNPAMGPALPAAEAALRTGSTEVVTCDEIIWVQARTEEGHVYYWNIYDESTTWEQPTRFYTNKEYKKKAWQMKMSYIENYKGKTNLTSSKVVRKDIERYIKNAVNQTAASKMEVKRNVVAQVYPKTEDIPLPEDVPEVKEEPEEEKEEEDDDDDVVDESQPRCSTKKQPEPEDTRTQNAVKFFEQGMPSKMGAPFGAWMRVKEEEKSAVPFVSPLTERYRREEEEEKKELQAIAEGRLEDVQRIVFEEKTAEVSTKKVKGPIEFKKRSAARNVRKRDDE